MKRNRNTFEMFVSFAEFDNKVIGAREIYLSLNLNWKQHKDLMRLFESYNLLKFTPTQINNIRHDLRCKAYHVTLTELGRALYNAIKSAKEA